MTEHTDLHAQLAQRLFEWTCDGVDWTDAESLWHRTPPAYTTDPAATAQVWQWLETVGQMQDVSFHYDQPPGVACQMTYSLPGDAEYHFVFTTGPTWPEALCRAALALAEAMDGQP